MFDFVRQHTKIIMAVLFLLIIPSFVLFGLEGYTRFNERDNKVAEVAGRDITQAEWDHAHRAQIDRLRAANPAVDLALLDSPAMKYAALEDLVRERVLTAAANDALLGVSDARLAAQLGADPGIASLRREDGSLDMERYRRLLAAQGLTPEGFEAGVRADLAREQVLGGVIESGFASSAQAEVAMNAFLEQREARVLRFNPADFVARLAPSEADLQTYYQAHAGRYQAPESARIEYIVLDLDGVKRSLSVSEPELRTYYEQNRAAFGAPEQRRASHILLTAPKDAPAAERERAKAAAAALLERLRQAPASFAELARQSSQDDASAASGGDLGFFQRDKGLEPSLAQAAFELAKVGDISDVIESDFGYHIVRLTEIKPAAVPSFEALRAQLEDQWRSQEAQKLFGELADSFTNGVYEQSDSLQPVADKLKLTLQTADGVQRTPAPGASGALASAKFLGALFSADAIDKKRNTEAVEIGANQLASGRIVTHSPAHAKPFDQVRAEVRAAYLAERGGELARQEGQARLQAWTAQPDSASGLPAAVALSRADPRGQPEALVEAVLRADPAKLPTFVGVDLGLQGYALARVEKVLPQPPLAPAVVGQNLSRYEQLWGVAEARAYYEVLKSRYKARILAPEPSAAPR